MPVHKLSSMLLLIVTLVLTLTACGGQSAAPPPAATSAPAKTENTPVPATTQAQTENTPTPAPTAPAESAPAKTENTPTPAPTEAPTATPQPVAVEPATVHQAAQLLDLRQLALPEKAELSGQAEVGQVSYQTPLEVKAVADFYRALLGKEGWQEVSGQGYADDTTAVLYFIKDGFTLSLSASQMGGEGVSVTVMHHGNVDPSSLPQMADAESVMAMPNTLIYFSPTPVSEVAEFTRKELAAQGWQEYSRPSISQLNNEDTQTLDFKQNGLVLSAYITTAPAQDGKTSVQYSLMLLPLDLPTPADATALQIEAGQPYLSFKTPAKPEQVVDFYRQALGDLGWTEVTGEAVISAEQASVAFANEAEKLALTLTAALADGQTTATLSASGAEAPVATEDETVVAEATSTTSNTGSTESGSAAGAMPDLPTPDDAKDLAFDPDMAQITYASPSDVATLVEFYRQALPALDWQENEIEGVVTDIFSYLSFSKGDDDLTIDLTADVINKGTTVTVDVSGLAPSQEIAATSEPATPAADGPAYTIKDWPVPPGAEKVEQSGDKLSYVVGLKIPAIAEFYQPTFEKMELSASCLDDVEKYTSISCSFSNGTLSLNFFAFEGFDNQSEVEITFTNSAVGPSDESADTSGDSGALTAEDQDGLPVPDNHTSLSSEGSPYSRKIILTSPASVDDLVAFYQTELAKTSWEAKDTVTEAGGSILTFTGPDGELTVEIKPSGDEAEVTLTNRNPDAAAKAGILPPAGQARLYMVNFSPDELAVTVKGQEVKVKGEAGMNSPDDAPKLDLPPGSYEVTIKAGDKSTTAQIELGADEVWTLMLDPEGGMPLQVY